MRFSANLGFLFTDRSLPDAIRAASESGFDAVECHFPYETPPLEVLDALNGSGIPMLGLNTSSGSSDSGDKGLAALPGRESEARDAIDQALEYAIGIGAKQVHVMAGLASGNAARSAFCENLSYAAMQASRSGTGIVIEPLNTVDNPGYFLCEVEQGVGIIREVDQTNVKLMFDCYHVQIMQGNILDRARCNLDLIGHVQFASVPGRHEPHLGEVNYPWLLQQIKASGYDGYFGAEYLPLDGTVEGLDWLSRFRAALPA